MPRPVPALLKPSRDSRDNGAAAGCCQYRRTRHLFRPPHGKLGKPSHLELSGTPKAACCSTSAALKHLKAGRDSVRYRCGWMPVCCAGNGKVSRNRVHSTGWIYSRLNLMHLSLSTRVKAADAAADLLPGFVSVTSPNGAQSPDKADWLALKGRTVFIWPDADQPGETYAREVARLALRCGALRVSILNLALLAQQRTPPGDELPQG